MRLRLMFLLGLVVGSLLTTDVALAQKKPDGGADSRRQGFWWGIGLGAGSAGLECSGCSSDREGSGSGYLRMGGTLSPHWLLGGELDAWAKSRSGVDAVMANLAIVASWYPSGSGGFFLKFGLGGIAYQEDGGLNKLEAMGGSAIVGIGYDIPIGRSTSLTPFFNSIASARSKVRIDGATVSGMERNPNLLQVGLAISFH